MEMNQNQIKPQYLQLKEADISFRDYFNAFQFAVVVS